MSIQETKEFRTLGELLINLSDKISSEIPAGIVIPSPEQKTKTAGFDFYSRDSSLDRKLRKKARELESLPCQVNIYKNNQDPPKKQEISYIFEIQTTEQDFFKAIEYIKQTTEQLNAHFKNKYK